MLKIKHTEWGYGFFPGGDPRRFSPDCDSTAEELEHHRKACASWDAGGRESESDGTFIPGVGFVDRCQFGLGSYTWDEELWVWDWMRWVALPQARGAAWRWWEWTVKPEAKAIWTEAKARYWEDR